MKRLVLDTNVLISALFWKGAPRKLYAYIRAGKYIMLFTNDMSKELIRVLSHKKFGLTAQEIFPILVDIRRHTHWVHVKTKIDVIKEDPTDNIFLECAAEGDADCIISGDRHLLSLKNFQGIPILKVREFLERENIESQ